MDDLISVIIPIYNIENYIDKCVDSVINQSYSNLDIILVDDGSTDKSSLICEKWKVCDNRIRVIHKKNGGLADARNAGLEVAKGNFISFVDGDDYIEKDMYFDMIRYLKEQICDIAICNIEKTEPSRKFITKPYSYGNSDFKIISNVEAVKDVLTDKIDVSSCNKVYRRSVIKNIKFPYGKTNEDFPFLCRAFHNSKKIIVINKVYYNYIQRENSITTTAFSRKQFDKYYNCLDVCNYVENHMPEIMYEARHYLWYQIFCLLKKVCLDEIEEKYIDIIQKMRATIKKDVLNIISSKQLTFKEKTMYLMICYMPKFYRLQHKGSK